MAVLFVVVFHAWPGVLPGGYVGVDVFFVISGYLITGLLLREVAATGRVDFAAFYARRIRRLLPAASLVIATSAIVALNMAPLGAGDVASTAIAAAAYVSNIWFALLAVDYLQEGLHRNVLLHTWSLGVEEQFYLVWPVLIAGAMLLQRRLGVRHAAGWMVTCISALSFLACLWLTVSTPSWAFFGLPTRAWQLGAGAVAALLEDRSSRLAAPARGVLAGAGLLGIAASGLAFSARTPFPGYAALLPVLGAFLVIVAGTARAAHAWPGLSQVPWLQRLGDLSYSWYLWHWPALILLADAWPAADRNLISIAGVAGSLALAALTYVAVENPVRWNRGLLHAAPARTMVLGLLLVAGTIGAVGAARLAALRGEEVENRRRMEQAASDRPRLYDERCFAAAPDTEPPECFYGAANGRHTIALVGDSHAAQWFPALESLAAAHGLRLAVFVKAACPLARVEPYDPKLNRPYTECTQWREKVFLRLAGMRPALVISSSDGFYEPFVRRDREAIRRWQEGLAESLDRLGEVAGHIVLIRDTPRPGFHVPACLARTQTRGGRAATPCPYFLSEAILPDPFVVEQAAVRGRPAAALLDMNDTICATAICPVERGGVILFHDSQHLGATFARSLAGSLWLRLPEAVRASLVE